MIFIEYTVHVDLLLLIPCNMFKQIAINKTLNVAIKIPTK